MRFPSLPSFAAIVPSLLTVALNVSMLPALPAQSASREAAAPHVKLSADRFDFGTVKAGTTVSGELSIKNEGDAPLDVTRIGVTCECATLHLSTPTRLNVPIDSADEGKTQLALGPGEAATLKLTVDTTKLPAGPFEKRCLILCSDRTKSPLSVPFAVNVERAAAEELGKGKETGPGSETRPAHPAHERSGHGDAENLDQVGRQPRAPEIDGPVPRIECDSYKASFGEVYRGEQLYRTFKLKNTGEGDLAIREIRNTCSCAAAKLTIGGQTLTEEQIKDKKNLGVLKTGEEALLDVELKTAKAPLPGKDVLLSKQVRIYTNDPTQPMVALTLEATMISPFTLEPIELDFGRVNKGEGPTLTAVLWSDKLGTFDITDVRSPNDELLKVTATRVVSDEKIIPPTWRIEATLSKAAPLGTHRSNIELSVNHERVKEILLPVRLSVEPNVRFIGNRKDGGEILDFEVMTGEADKTIELTIVNGDPAVPYVPKVTIEARPLSDAFKAELVEVEKGIQYVVKVTAPKSLMQAKFINGEVILTADHPDLPVKKVKFRGWFRPAQPPAAK